MGQEVSVTPIQIISAISAVAWMIPCISIFFTLFLISLMCCCHRFNFFDSQRLTFDLLVGEEESIEVKHFLL